MTTQLLIIDPQNDFCDVPLETLANPGDNRPALPVTGAWADMNRLAELLKTRGDAIDAITVTLDSHPLIGIERPLFWETGEGKPVEPFTIISADELRAGKYRPAMAELQHDDRVLNVLEVLASQGKPGVMVWPAHCTVNTWGHQMVAPVAGALERWTREFRRPTHYVFKGTNLLTEHFGAFETDVVLADAPETAFNHGLAKRLAQADTLLVAGEASSHCVAASVLQLLDKTPELASRIILLIDCMSPVPGFEATATAFYRNVAALGVRVLTAAQWMEEA